MADNLITRRQTLLGTGAALGLAGCSTSPRPSTLDSEIAKLNPIIDEVNKGSDNHESFSVVLKTIRDMKPSDMSALAFENEKLTKLTGVLEHAVETNNGGIVTLILGAFPRMAAEPIVKPDGVSYYSVRNDVIDHYAEKADFPKAQLQKYIDAVAAIYRSGHPEPSPKSFIHTVQSKRESGTHKDKKERT